MERVYKDNNLYQLLEEICPRPGLYLGSNDITLLEAFINGYYYAHHKLNYFDEIQTTLFPLPFWFFHEFVKNYYKEFSSVAGWCNIILNHNNNDSKLSLTIFYQLINIFKNLSHINCWITEINEKHNKYNDSNSNAPKISFYSKNYTPIYSNIVKVYIFELSNNAGFICAVETNKDFLLLKEITMKKETIIKSFINHFDDNLIWIKSHFEIKLEKDFNLIPSVLME